MGKSLKNAVSPDEMYEQYGADTLRLYEMATGPLDASRPWETRDVVGMYRFLQRLWRNMVDEDTGECTVVDDAGDDETRKLLHRTIDTVRTEMDALRFNTAIAKLIELNNAVTKLDATPREVAEPMVLMLAPLVPHVAEELWRKLGSTTTRSPTSTSRSPTRRCWSTTRSRSRPGQRQGAGPHRRRRRRRPGRPRSRGAGRRQGRRGARRRDAEEGHRRARPHGQRRRLTTPLPRVASTPLTFRRGVPAPRGVIVRDEPWSRVGLDDGGDRSEDGGHGRRAEGDEADHSRSECKHRCDADLVTVEHSRRPPPRTELTPRSPQVRSPPRYGRPLTRDDQRCEQHEHRRDDERRRPLEVRPETLQ